MALSITQAFSKQAVGTTPLLNARHSNYNGRTSGLSIAAVQKKQFWDWFRQRPELNSPVSARVNDTIAEVEFFDLNGQSLGRNKRIEAEKYWDDNFMDERLKSVWFDTVVTGDGFGWKGRVNKRLVKEAVDSYVKGLGLTNTKELTKELLSKAIDEDVRKVRVFDYVASSTMEILHDEHDVLGFRQMVDTKVSEFDVDEIVHFTFNRIDGRVNGYTPVASLAPELIMLWFIKENMMAYMRNQGLPRKVFSLAEEMANSANHQFLMQQLETYGAVQNRHGNLVLTGKVDVIDLEEKLRDMEYEDLALYITSNIAYALQIPVSRIPYMIGNAQSAGDAGGLAENGYWSMIESDRRKIENLLNTQLFCAMGWTVKFKKAVRVENLREVQAWSMKADAVTKVDAVLAKFGKKLSEEKLLSLMELQKDDVVEGTNEELMIENTGLRNQNMLNNQDLSKGDASLRRNNSRTEAVNNPKGNAQDGN